VRYIDIKNAGASRRTPATNEKEIIIILKR
jgi:hypothetical protein